MISSATDRLALPLLDAGQAQKEVTHNEALLLLDLLVQPSVKGVGRNDPPAEPSAGERWIVGTMPTGLWAGKPDALASWTAAGWRMAAPRTGMRAWSEADGVEAVFLEGAWELGTVSATRVRVAGNQVVGTRQPAVMNAVDGSVVDVEARAALAALLDAIRAHGLIDR